MKTDKLLYSLRLLLAAGAFVISGATVADLAGCEEHIVGGALDNAPRVSATDARTYNDNILQCYQAREDSFFALEFWPEGQTPLWASYRVSAERYGPNRCRTYARNMNNCYFSEQSWEKPYTCPASRPDPFHKDHLFQDSLPTNAFSNSGYY